MQSKTQNRGFFTRFIALIHYLAMGIASLILAIIFASNKVIFSAFLLITIAMFFLAIQYFAVSRLMKEEEHPPTN